MVNLEKKDSVTLIRIYEKSRLYNFFLFTLTATEILILEKKFQRIGLSHHFKTDQNYIDFTELQRRFHSLTDAMLLLKSDDEQNSFSELSFNEILYLLSSIDIISKYLLGLEDPISYNLIDEVGSVTGIGSDWDKYFFKEAQFVFDEMKQAFKSYPEIIEMVTNIKG